ncbi:DUF5060 domain-containing protein [Gilvimarinus agarilyticus]|uniref:DUF5060 domain-containing protein n=1 Tax=Gilvimarinus agarilyticus TaxID=679259 RepID=UPI000A87C3E9|nr:DUF5060 domain-containing protein [Gilvimarinus agarilyticus]
MLRVLLLFLIILSSVGCSQYSKNDMPYENDNELSAEQFKTFSIDIDGPMVSETDALNPFTNYVVWTEFSHESGKSWNVRGFFAADGSSAVTSADAGEIWRTNFTPQLKGNYQYKTYLYKGKNAAILSFYESKSNLTLIAHKSGNLSVASGESHSSIFEENGILSQKDGYFYFPNTGKYWLKGGSNSPENLLGYSGFDGTYRVSEQSRDGEAKIGTDLHSFSSHIKDYEQGDPLWGDPSHPKGKGLIGSVNYLANQGINAQYFLTMNIKGDGNDVWPFLDHETFDRFDVSKLAQWELVFKHMQDKGILLHVVTQETENETLLDSGDVGDLRKLYYAELIARFSHHNALVWNLGEENGPEDWTPIAQDDGQRIAMAKYFSENDPYQHPVLIHTHSSSESKDHLLTPLLNSTLDGISLQIEYRHQVYQEIIKWRGISGKRVNRTPWLLTMDEIGKWYTGAKVDLDDPTHESLRRHVLWPTFLAGGAGVEWYSGAHQPHNDLSTENFYVRESLWKITRIARNFIERHVPIWELSPLPVIVDRTITIEGVDGAQDELLPASSFYGASNKNYFIGYLIQRNNISIEMPSGEYEQLWLNPISGVVREKPTLSITGGKTTIVLSDEEQKSDWVLLLKRRLNDA